MAAQDTCYIAGFYPFQNQQNLHIPQWSLLCPYLLPLIRGCDQPEFRYSPRSQKEGSCFPPSAQSGLQRTSSKRAKASRQKSVYAIVSVCFHARLNDVSKMFKSKMNHSCHCWLALTDYNDYKDGNHCPKGMLIDPDHMFALAISLPWHAWPALQGTS